MNKYIIECNDAEDTNILINGKMESLSNEGYILQIEDCPNPIWSIPTIEDICKVPAYAFRDRDDEGVLLRAVYSLIWYFGSWDKNDTLPYNKATQLYILETKREAKVKDYNKLGEEIVELNTKIETLELSDNKGYYLNCNLEKIQKCDKCKHHHIETSHFYEPNGERNVYEIKCYKNQNWLNCKIYENKKI